MDLKTQIMKQPAKQKYSKYAKKKYKKFAEKYSNYCKIFQNKNKVK